MIRRSTHRTLLCSLIQFTLLAFPITTQARDDEAWCYRWNPLTGTPHTAFGPGLVLSPEPLLTSRQVEMVARGFVADHADLLGVDPQSARIRSIVGGNARWGVLFTQEHQGLEVEGARLWLALTRSGRLYAFGSDWFPGVKVDPVPALDRQAASMRAAGTIGFVNGRDRELDADLIIVPQTTERSVVYRLAWRCRHRIEDPPGLWISHLDAQTGEILGQRNDVVRIDVIGTTAADVEDWGYCDGEHDRPFPNLEVNLQGGASGYSDTSGVFVLPHEGTEPVTITARLDGRWIDLTNPLGPEPIFTGIAVPGIPLEIRWTDGNSLDAERSAYLHINRIHDLLQRYDPGWTDPDYPMPIQINADFTCGAFWDGTGIRLGRAGAGCAEIARLGDVIYHEYAHGITQWIYGGNPEDVGEGNADTAAHLITGDPILGEGFFLGDCETGLRDARNNLRYPDDYIPGQPFHNGQIIAGFWWDAREALAAQYGEEEAFDVAWRVWHLSRRHFQPVSMPDQVFFAFVEDDDDGDLTNGTPHYAEFCAAATNHGFECPLEGSGVGDDQRDASRPAEVSCRPNPMTTTTTVHYVSEGAGDAARITLTVFDSAGRLVRTLVAGPHPPGSHQATWDGTDDRGQRLSSGVYYLRIAAAGLEKSCPVVVLN